MKKSDLKYPYMSKRKLNVNYVEYILQNVFKRFQ